jgi:hypothetical protein
VRKLIVAATAAAAMAITPGTALGIAADAPGQKIANGCGASFGQLVSGGKKSGSSFHTNYAGGANAFSADAILAAHGCA